MRRLLQSLLARNKDSYKYNFGHVLVVGGSAGLSGAVYLSSTSALKIGAGLVTAACPEYLAPIMEIKTTEVMTLSLPQTSSNTIASKAEEVVEDFIKQKKVNVMALGPGLSLDKQSQKVCLNLIENSSLDLVVDADGIKVLKDNLDVLKKSKAKSIVLTPHLSEFSYITGLSIAEIKKEREQIAKEFSSEYRVVLVLKGQNTLVACESKVHKNTTGNPSLSKAGTGDVLTGLIAGIIAQEKLSPSDSAELAVYLHGLAADILVKEKTILCVLARDLIECLPQAISKAAGHSRSW